LENRDTRQSRRHCDTTIMTITKQQYHLYAGKLQHPSLTIMSSEFKLIKMHSVFIDISVTTERP
jgi:hypothetical protein